MHPKKTAEERKQDKEKRKIRKARVIIRNLSYKVTENELNAEFSKYGKVTETNILKREDGKLIGCAFVQYDKVNHAAKAIHHGNGKEFMGSSIVIDWAVNRKKFNEHLKKLKTSTVKTEQSDDAIEIKNEIKTEDSSDEEKSENNDDNSDQEMNDDNSNSDNENSSIKEEIDEKKINHKKSNDVAERCTVFIKNIPFESTSDDLRKVCRQFGLIHYAVITVDKVSGHSKGTGFVKYKVMKD